MLCDDVVVLSESEGDGRWRVQLRVSTRVIVPRWDRQLWVQVTSLLHGCVSTHTVTTLAHHLACWVISTECVTGILISLASPHDYALMFLVHHQLEWPWWSSLHGLLVWYITCTSSVAMCDMSCVS